MNNFSCGAVLYLNGGSFYENIVVTSDTLAIPIKKGYVFGGWYENADFSGTSVENIEKGYIYYAKWNEKASTSISFKDGLDLHKTILTNKKSDIF
ncbi:InlB B-repeat-containing protein [[Clostridium] innocuum]|nr:InlB B-repeat-containing protein [[Clostridium] innocuum]